MSGSACASALEYRPAATSACRASKTGPQYSMRRASSLPAAEPAGAGNGGLAGAFVLVVFSIVIPFRAVPDLVRSAAHALLP